MIDQAETQSPKSNWLSSYFSESFAVVASFVSAIDNAYFVNPYKTLDISSIGPDVLRSLAVVASVIGTGIALGAAIISLPIYFFLGDPPYNFDTQYFIQIAEFFLICALLQALFYLVSVIPLHWHATSRLVTRREEIRSFVEANSGMDVFAEDASWDQYAKHVLDFFDETRSVNNTADLVGRVASPLFWLFYFSTGSAASVLLVIYLVYQGAFDSAYLLWIFIFLRVVFYAISASVAFLTKTLTGRYPSEPRLMRECITSELNNFLPPFEQLDELAEQYGLREMLEDEDRRHEKEAVDNYFISRPTYHRWKEEAKHRLSAEGKINEKG